MTRPSLDSTLIAVAHTWARRSTCSRLQVGAVLARDGRTLSTGYNGAPSGLGHCAHDDDTPCAVSVHAEVNALVFAARHGVSTEGAGLYLTHSPCRACAGPIVNAGVREVVFAEAFRSLDGVAVLQAAGVAVREAA